MSSGGAKKGWDLTSTHSMGAAAEWLRSRSDAILVLVVRGERGTPENPLAPDLSFAVDDRVSARSAREMVESVLDEMEEQLVQQRLDKLAAAREKKCAENIRAGGRER